MPEYLLHGHAPSFATSLVLAPKCWGYCDEKQALSDTPAVPALKKELENLLMLHLTEQFEHNGAIFHQLVLEIWAFSLIKDYPFWMIIEVI